MPAQSELDDYYSHLYFDHKSVTREPPQLNSDRPLRHDYQWALVAHPGEESGRGTRSIVRMELKPRFSRLTPAAT